jgi:hypothetical protein
VGWGGVKVVEVEGKGRGLVACEDLGAGTTLFVSRPIVAQFEDVDEDEDEDDEGSDDDNDEDSKEEGGGGRDFFVIDPATARLTIRLCDALVGKYGETECFVGGEEGDGGGGLGSALEMVTSLCPRSVSGCVSSHKYSWFSYILHKPRVCFP